MGTNRLGVVGESFRQWQSKHGRGVGYHIPEGMREEALALLDEYSVIEVSRELGVNRDTVGRWRRQRGLPKKRVKVERPSKQVQFIEVKGVQGSAFGSVMTLEWVRPDGNQMRLTGCRKRGELRCLINEFLTAGAR